jgi:3',5'-cyclic AMP phosphodiesterase CpdA
VRGPVALIGLCTAAPTPPFLASGVLGRDQLERLERLLSDLSQSSLCRIVLLHHPPGEGAVSRRRALRDASALRAVLRRHGADLVLHGHAHRLLVGALEGPRGDIPVVGVRSSSYAGPTPEKRAQYHLYAVESRGAGAWPRFRVTLRIRGYDPAAGCFAGDGERLL